MANLRLGAVLLVAASCGRSVPLEGPLASGPGSFVAVGFQGLLFRSPDAVHWTEQVSGSSKSLNSIAAGGSSFVAVGAAGTVVTSTNGTAWTAPTSGVTADLTHVIFTGEKFIAVGSSWSTGSTMIESTDGASWTVVSAPANYMFRAVAHSAGIVIASANHLSDLQTPAIFTTTLSTGSAGGGWVQREGPDFSDSVTVGDRIVVVGHGLVASTRDGISWSEQKATADHAIAHGANTFVLVGESGAISSSTDGTHWTAATNTLDKGAWLSGVTFGANTFVAVGSGAAIATSADGTTWTQTAAASRYGFNDVAWAPF